MKFIPYAEALVRDKKDADAAAATYRAKEAAAQLNLEVVQLENEVARAESQAQDLATRHPLDASRLVEALDDLDLLKRKQDQLNDIAAQLFPKS